MGRLTIAVLLIYLLRVQSFAPVRISHRFFHRALGPTRSERFVSSKSKSETTAPVVTGSPSNVFGRPIDKVTAGRNKKLIHGVKSFLFDTIFAGDTLDRAFARFYALETIARMPYFSYLSVLHLYETVGQWRQAEYLKIHFAESWNELHHLLIMEELGGNNQWRDRFVAQHLAFGYYWMVVALYIFNPTLAYNFNQAVEEEAYETYDNFVQQNGEYLKQQPAPRVARQYYAGTDLYLFHAMHTIDDNVATLTQRQVKCDTLYDTFCNVRDDEMEHVKTMQQLQVMPPPIDNLISP